MDKGLYVPYIPSNPGLGKGRLPGYRKCGTVIQGREDLPMGWHIYKVTIAGIEVLSTWAFEFSMSFCILMCLPSHSRSCRESNCVVAIALDYLTKKLP